ncbi:hypothetical protein AOLI_G00143010 [Acnodon oligacanthus]
MHGFCTPERMVKVVFAAMIFIPLVGHSFVHAGPTGSETKSKCNPSSSEHKRTGPDPVNSEEDGCETTQQSTSTSTGPDCVNSAGHVTAPESCTIPSQVTVNFTKEFMRAVHDTLSTRDLNMVMRAVRNLETALERSTFSKPESMKEGNLTTHLYKVDKPSGNLNIYANDSMAHTNASQVLSSIVQVTLPEELVATIVNTTVVFCMIISPTQYENVTDGRIIGVSVSGKNVSGLKSSVNISVHVGPLATREPKCVFYNFTSSKFEDSGCLTRTREDHVICSCDHLTYFAILMVSPNNVSEKDKVVLSYISQVGCSLSLLFLVVAVILYFVKWRSSADQSQRVHISLTVALILLNGHFIMNDLVVNVQTACIYVAVLLHYSLLATFTWTAIEGFHLYLLLLRVFNIYIRRYLLKLSLVGWGVPAVVVILIFIIDKHVYLNVGSSSGNSSNTQVCYISNELVKNITIFGFFCVIFAFNLAMLVVVVRTLFFKHPVFPGQHQKRRAKDVCTILGITCLLGITWGLIFLSFGQLSTVGLYLFCIFNSLQGLFIFICPKAILCLQLLQQQAVADMNSILLTVLLITGLSGGYGGSTSTPCPDGFTSKLSQNQNLSSFTMNIIGPSGVDIMISDNTTLLKCSWWGFPCYIQCGFLSAIKNLSSLVEENICIQNKEDIKLDFILSESKTSCSVTLCREDIIIRLMDGICNVKSTEKELKRLLIIKNMCAPVLFKSSNTTKSYISIEKTCIHGIIRRPFEGNSEDFDLEDLAVTVVRMNMSTTNGDFVTISTPQVSDLLLSVTTMIPTSPFQNVPEEQSKVAVVTYSSARQFTYINSCNVGER